MKHFKATLLLFIFITAMNFFSSCTPESIADGEIIQKEQLDHIQATDDEDAEIDKSGKDD
ncbi:MAG: hypothetical protein ABGW99_06825 [Zunongwangia sp.]|uniref:hypothetical protein n=1 Tax=Zunongwangia sp. TaxID=1965325 RepID=UPI0032429D0D